MVYDPRIDQRELEALIDRHSLPRLIEAMAEICDQKAEHLKGQDLYPDRVRSWQTSASELRRLISRRVLSRITSADG